MASWANNMRAITLFVDDLAAIKTFYANVLELSFVFEDEHSVVFKIGETMLNFLIRSQAPELVEPASVAEPNAASQFVFTISVDDVDAMVARLEAKGIKLLNGPMDRPWGIRTASFQDPAGYVWEISK